MLSKSVAQLINLGYSPLTATEGVTVEFVGETATRYHKGRVLHYMVEEGLSEGSAVERADMDLIEWTKPLPMPPASSVPGAWEE